MVIYLKKKVVFISLKIDFVQANSAVTDKMLQCAVLYLGIHCLPRYLFRGFWSPKV